jgi:hypothetical protein
MKEMLGADEIHMHPVAVIRRQASTTIENLDQSIPAGFAHADKTDLGALQIERAFFPAPAREGVRRTAHFNMWRLLSSSPTPCPLALADARTETLEDVVTGLAFFPSADLWVDTAFYHPNDHLRWVYFSQLNNQQLLVFKQYDSDKRYPSRVPHTAFNDPSCPASAAPRVSVECRCIVRWY